MAETPADAQVLLQVQDAYKTYRKGRDHTVALDHVNLTVAADPATITTIAGESGSGKTTLANAVLGFTTLTSGRILYRGRDVSTLGRRDLLAQRREVQAVFQDPFGVYNPFYKIGHVFHTAIRQFKLARTRTEAARLIDEALDVVGLRGKEILDHHPHQLSGGQRQRIMMARAYLLHPKLIVADEPVSMVDASLRALILNIMVRMRDEEGISFLYITHDLSTAYQVGDGICILNNGSIVERGDTRAVIDNPQHEYSKLLVSSIPVPDPSIRWAPDQVVRDQEGSP